MLITSTSNPKIKEANSLWKRSEREETGLFLIEGYRELLRASISDYKIEKLFICPELFLGSNEETLIENLAKNGVEVFICHEKVFRKLSYRDRPDGLIATAFQKKRSLDELNGNLFIIAEGIEKPGNLGTILRSSDAAKVDGVIVCDRQTDIHNPNVVRASVGTLFTIPVVEEESQKVFKWLLEKKIAIVASTPSADLIYTDAPLNQPLALVVGAEQYGLSPLWMENAHLKVKIPMLGIADSLNVAMATTLLIYEARRQRDLLR